MALTSQHARLPKTMPLAARNWGSYLPISHLPISSISSCSASQYSSVSQSSLKAAAGPSSSPQLHTFTLRSFPGHTSIHSPQHLRTHRSYLCHATSSYSREAQKAIRHAHEQAARQGEPFVSTDHLFLGILATSCAVTSLFWSYGVEFGSVRNLAESSAVMPTHELFRPEDVELSSSSREVLGSAREGAEGLGQPYAGTAHITLVLLSLKAGLLAEVIAGKVAPGMLNNQLMDLAEQQQEQPGHVTPVQDQVASLKAAYRQLSKPHKQAGGARAVNANLQWTPGQGREPPPMSQQEHNDIYE